MGENDGADTDECDSSETLSLELSALQSRTAGGNSPVARKSQGI